MKKGFKAGEYIHVPANTFAWRMDERGDVKSYIITQSPVALMCLGSHADPKFHDSTMYNVFYEGKVFSVNEDDIYSLEDK